MNELASIFILICLVWLVVALVAALVATNRAKEKELADAYDRGWRNALMTSNARLESVLYDHAPKIIHFDGVTKKEVSR